MKWMLLLLPLSLSACVSTAPPEAEQPPFTLPAAWSEATAPAAGTVLAQWWNRFDDPLLAALIERALAANGDIRSAQATLRQARAARDLAAAGLAPNLTASTSAQRNAARQGNDSNLFNAAFTASWEADVFGARRSALHAAEAGVQASAARLGGAQVATAAEVALDYIALRGVQVRLGIARANLAGQLEIEQITAWRLQAGLLTSLEAEQARTASEQARAQIPPLETSAAQLRHSLALLCGQAPRELPAPLSSGAGPVPRAPDDLALSIPAAVLRQRPDVRAAEQDVQAALAQVSQAEAARYPTFTLNGSVGLRALTLGTLAGGAGLFGSLLGNVSAPLFDGGAIEAGTRIRQAALEQAHAAYRTTVLNALKEVEDVLVALGGERARVRQLRAASAAAANAALIARERYMGGLSDFQSLLETQRSLYGTQDALASTEAGLSADHVRLYQALGGGWQTESPAPSAARHAASPATVLK